MSYPLSTKQHGMLTGEGGMDLQCSGLPALNTHCPSSHSLASYKPRVNTATTEEKPTFLVHSLVPASSLTSIHYISRLKHTLHASQASPSPPTYTQAHILTSTHSTSSPRR